MSRFIPVNAWVFDAPVFRDTENVGPYYAKNGGVFQAFFPDENLLNGLMNSEVTGVTFQFHPSTVKFNNFPEGWSYELAVGVSMQENTGGDVYRFFPIKFSTQQMESGQNVQSQTSDQNSQETSGENASGESSEGTSTQNASGESSEGTSTQNASGESSEGGSGNSASPNASVGAPEDAQPDSDKGLAIAGAILLGWFVFNETRSPLRRNSR